MILFEIDNPYKYRYFSYAKPYVLSKLNMFLFKTSHNNYF